MGKLKVTSWNMEWFQRAVTGQDTPTKQKRRAAVAKEILDLDPDVLCMVEAPKDLAALQAFIANNLPGVYSVVEASDGEYATGGIQWTRFLVKQGLASKASLLPVSTWDSFAGKSWTVHYWGVHLAEQHKHYRHPQVLVLDLGGQRVEFIGLHLKSKLVNAGEKSWASGGQQREQFIEEALKARIKLATEATNVRNYIDAKFAQVPNPAILLMGDLNDGPGKELLEEQYLFFDLVSNVQGDVFFAKRFLNHALFDFPENLRWTVEFKDYMQPERDPRILLDHILFTQGLVDGSLPLQVNARAGKVEHEIHELVNAHLEGSARTSDHRPVSVIVDTSI